MMKNSFAAAAAVSSQHTTITV